MDDAVKKELEASCIFFVPPRSKLGDYLKIPQVQDTFMALRSLCREEAEEVELEEQVALTCAEAVRYAYKLGRELGIDKDTFLSGLNKIMEVEDEDYRLRYHN
jgi:hypothetical protein